MRVPKKKRSYRTGNRTESHSAPFGGVDGGFGNVQIGQVFGPTQMQTAACTAGLEGSYLPTSDLVAAIRQDTPELDAKAWGEEL